MRNVSNVDLKGALIWVVPCSEQALIGLSFDSGGGLNTDYD